MWRYTTRTRWYRSVFNLKICATSDASSPISSHACQLTTAKLAILLESWPLTILLSSDPNECQHEWQQHSLQQWQDVHHLPTLLAQPPPAEALFGHHGGPPASEVRRRLPHRQVCGGRVLLLLETILHDVSSHRSPLVVFRWFISTTLF